MSAQIRRVVCSGVGMVSPIGVGIEMCWPALLQSKCGIGYLKKEHSYNNNPVNVAAYVPDEELVYALDCKKHEYLVRHSKQLSRATKLALLAAHEALEDADMIDSTNSLKEKFRDRTGVAIGQGMVDFEDIYQNGFHVFSERENVDGNESTEEDSNEVKENGGRKISPYFMTRALVNMSAGNVSIRYKTRGPNHCVSTACATGSHSIGDAYNFIKTGQADVMICGSTEAAINRLSIAGFARMKALAFKYNDQPEISSRPFDTKRVGFVMGEGAGIMILEALEHFESRKMSTDRIYGEILGYASTSDGYHLTAPLPDGDGGRACMIQALKNANLKPIDVTQVNAHATSTPRGDEIEANAIENLFYHKDETRNELKVTSCKGSIGHLLGAAGSVESIFSIMSCKHSVIPHCLNLDNPITTKHNLVEFVKEKPATWDQDRRIVVKNSFGFGGTNASLVLSNFIK